MQALSTLRTTIQNLTLRSLGAMRSNERYKSGNRVSDLFTNTVVQLPANPNIEPLQNWNDESATYGSFYFLVGYDPVGDDGSKPIGP